MDTFNSLLDRMFDWVITVIPKVIAAIVIFLVMFYLAGLVARWIRRTGERRGLNPEVTLLLTRLGSWGMITLGVIWALQQVNFNLTAFLAGLGIIGFTVGFALQDISRNFVAGLLLLWQQPFGIGDLIQVTGYTGRVTDVSLRATEIRTSDGLLVLIPNADVYTKPITNYTQAPRRRLAIKAWAPYGEDLERATAIALEAIGQEAPTLALAYPAPSVVFDSFGDSSV
ncbi:MAG TPA: mechanosensitive ion channel, partial [Anaerolineae bacterium]|nr:mechanosensitive ion channel [Anaerolineae bacterium]